MGRILVLDFDDVIIPTKDLVDNVVRKYSSLGTEDGWKNFEFDYRLGRISNDIYNKYKAIHDELMKQKEVYSSNGKVVDLDSIHNARLLATESEWALALI